MCREEPSESVNEESELASEESEPANKVLQSLLKEAGCSNGRLARRVNELGRLQGERTRYDKGAVTRWIKGVQPRGNTPKLIAEVLTDELKRPISPFDLGFTVDPLKPVVTRALSYNEDVSEALHTLAELGSTFMTRRSLLGTVPFVATALLEPQREWLLWLLEEDSHLPLAVTAGGGPVEQVQAMIALFDQMDNTYGGGGVHSSIVHYLTTEVVPLLQQQGLPHHQRKQLFTSAAKLSAMAGWSAYDSAEYGFALCQMNLAVRLCREGGDRVLGGQIFAGLSHLFTSLGYPKEGVALARTGIQTAKAAGSPMGLMRLHAMAARGYAALGEGRAATASLSEATQALDASKGAHQESEWVRFLDAHYLEAEAALCHRDLGESQKAERLAEASIAANAERRRRQAISRSVLATAHLQQGRLDEAIGTATHALDGLSGIHSERSVQAVQDFRSRLASKRREPLVREFESRAKPILGEAA